MVSDATASSRATSWNDGGGPRPARRAAPHVRAAARRATARRAGGGRRRGGAGRLGRRARRRDRRDGARRDARAGRAHGRCDRPRRGGSRRHARIRRSAHAPLLRRRAVGRIRDAPQRRRLPRGPGGRWRDPRDGAGDDGGKRRGAPRAPRPPDRRRARARHDDDRGEERLRPRARGGAAAAPDHRRREGDRAQRRGSHVPRRARAPRAVHRRPTALRARSARRPRDGSQPRDIAAGGHADRDRAGRDAVRSHASRGDRRGHDQRGARPRPRRSHRRAGRRAARRHRRPRHRRRARARVPHGRAAHRRGLRGRQARRVAELSTELQLLLVLAVVGALAVIAFFTRAGPGRIAAALVASVVVGFFVAVVDALAYGPGLWRYPIVDTPIGPPAFYVASGLGYGGGAGLVGWRLVRRFGPRAFGWFVAFFMGYGPLRDYAGAASSGLIVFGPGPVPAIADSLAWGAGTALGLGIVLGIGGPAGSDRLARDAAA